MKTSSAQKKSQKKKNDAASTTAPKEKEMNRHHNGSNAASEDRRQTNEETSNFERDVEATAREVVEDAEKAAEKAKTVSVDEYEKVKRERDEAKDRGLRALAELENFRARANRVAQEDRKYASLDLARAILPVWDNLGRAVAAAEENNSAEALVDGVKMVYNEFLNVLAKHNVVAIDALHQPFDPNFHESIAFMPNDEFPPNTVIVEAQKGFKLHDRVVRPTQVVLAAPTPKSSAASENQENDANE